MWFIPKSRVNAQVQSTVGSNLEVQHEKVLDCIFPDIKRRCLRDPHAVKYMCKYTCMYAHTSMYMYIYIYIYIYIYMCVCVCVFIWMCMCEYMFIHVYHISYFIY